MTASKREPRKTDDWGLPWAVQNAGSPVMRDFAAIALAKNLSQGDLARMIGLKTIGVTRHFNSKRPHFDTLKRYAKALGLPADYVSLVSPDPLPPKLINAAFEKVVKSLMIKAAYFREGTLEVVVDYIGRLDRNTQDAIARRVLLAEYRERIGIVDQSTLKYSQHIKRFGLPFVTFLAMVVPDLDLSERINGNADFTLVELWTWAGFVFSGDATSDGDELVDFACGLLEKHGIDTTTMRQTLEEHQMSFKRGIGIGGHVPSSSLHLPEIKSRRKR